MKKALALVLALVLALSMAVSAFGLKFVELKDQTPAEAEKTVINVVDAKDEHIFYTRTPGTYYVALDYTLNYKDIAITASGNVTAKLVDFDPETMEIKDKKTNPLTYDVYDLNGTKVLSNGTYDEAVDYAELLGKENHVAYKIVCDQYVNVIEITVEDNYTAHYTEGKIVVEAKLDKVPFKGTLTVINDVVNFEYEEVKYVAANFEDKEALSVGVGGYSDYLANLYGYDDEDKAYDYTENRTDDDAAVVSTTAFRAIEGEDLKVLSAGMEVVLKDIVKGQKGVNFKGYNKAVWNDVNENDKWDVTEELVSINFGFKGDQVVKGAYEISLELPYDWFQLRELFGLEVEEDDIISYYVVDENGKVVGGKEVDYMTADLTEKAEFVIKGENAKLGQYKLVLEVPAEEVGEANPNTGAESVVGVVAALAVVSVATAAAVSLKK